MLGHLDTYPPISNSFTLSTKIQSVDISLNKLNIKLFIHAFYVFVFRDSIYYVNFVYYSRFDHESNFPKP